MKRMTILLTVLVLGCAQQQRTRQDTWKPISVAHQEEPKPTSPAQETPKSPSKVEAASTTPPQAQSQSPQDQELEQLWKRRNAALVDGRIKVGMTVSEFLAIWGKPTLVNENARLSESHFAGHNMETADFRDWTQKRSPGHDYRHVIFTFDNGRLDSWHEF